MAFSKYLFNITSRPILRILLFLSISAGIFYLLYVFLPYEYFFEEPALFISALLGSMLTESFRLDGKWWSFGIRLDTHAYKNLISGALLAIGSMVIILIVSFIAGAEILYTGIQIKPLTFVLILLLLFTSAAFEEITFRGIIFQALAEKNRVLTGAVIINILFALIHLLNPHISLISLINIFLVGILLSYMFIETMSLWMPVSFHYFWNISEEMILGSPISGVKTGIGLFEINFTNSGGFQEILFGGNFGIESGIITTLIIIIIFLILSTISTYSPVQAANIFKKTYNESRFITNKKLNR